MCYEIQMNKKVCLFMLFSVNVSNVIFFLIIFTQPHPVFCSRHTWFQICAFLILFYSRNYGISILL